MHQDPPYPDKLTKRTTKMKHIETAFAFLNHVFRAAEKPKPEYTNIQTIRVWFFLNKRTTNQHEIDQLTDILAKYPKTGMEKRN